MSLSWFLSHDLILRWSWNWIIGNLLSTISCRSLRRHRCWWLRLNVRTQERMNVKLNIRIIILCIIIKNSRIKHICYLRYLSRWMHNRHLIDNSKRTIFRNLSVWTILNYICKSLLNWFDLSQIHLSLLSLRKLVLNLVDEDAWVVWLVVLGGVGSGSTSRNWRLDYFLRR